MGYTVHHVIAVTGPPHQVELFKHSFYEFWQAVSMTGARAWELYVWTSNLWTIANSVATYSKPSDQQQQYQETLEDGAKIWVWGTLQDNASVGLTLTEGKHKLVTVNTDHLNMNAYQLPSQQQHKDIIPSLLQHCATVVVNQRDLLLKAWSVAPQELKERILKCAPPKQLMMLIQIAEEEGLSNYQQLKSDALQLVKTQATGRLVYDIACLKRELAEGLESLSERYPAVIVEVYVDHEYFSKSHTFYMNGTGIECNPEDCPWNQGDYIDDFHVRDYDVPQEQGWQFFQGEFDCSYDYEFIFNEEGREVRACRCEAYNAPETYNSTK